MILYSGDDEIGLGYQLRELCVRMQGVVPFYMAVFAHEAERVKINFEQ